MNGVKVSAMRMDLPPLELSTNSPRACPTSLVLTSGTESSRVRIFSVHKSPTGLCEPCSIGADRSYIDRKPFHLVRARNSACDITLLTIVSCPLDKWPIVFAIWDSGGARARRIETYFQRHELPPGEPLYSLLLMKNQAKPGMQRASHIWFFA